jgi:hypothetical protein
MGRGESLHDVRELCELKYVDEVNRYLDAGWIFVKAPVEEELFYVVGWPLEEPPAHPKGPTIADLHESLAAAAKEEARKGS